MFDKPQSSHALGLDLDAFTLKGAALSCASGTVKIDQLYEFFVESPVETEVFVKPLYTTEEKATLEELYDDYLVVTSATTKDVLVRPLEIRLKKEKDIDSALIFQVEPLLPYPPENAIVDKILLSKDKDGSKLTVLTIRKDHLQQQLEQWKLLDIEPEIVSAAPQALALFARKYLAKDTSFYAIHLGIDNAFCVLIDEGKLIAAQVISEGLNPLIDILVQEKTLSRKTAFDELLKWNFNKPRSDDSPALKSGVDALRMSVMRTIYSLGKQLKGKEIGEILVTGSGAAIPGLADALSKQLNMARLALPDTAIGNATQEELLVYAVPIGEALSGLPLYKDQINFRQQEFSYPEPWKRLKPPLIQYIALCVAIAISLFIFGEAYLGYQVGAIKRQYIELLDMMNKPYQEFEAEYTSKNPSIGRTSSDQGVSIEVLTVDEMRSRLNYLQKGIQATPQIFPLYPNVPQVTDVLAWITAHPAFVSKQVSEYDKETEEFLHIDSFNYTMIKRPEPTKKMERYQVKIDLEFSSPTPKMAREFHDALIAPNDLVDPKGEVKWSSNRDRYRTSFYLKDKTVYSNN